MKSLMNNPILYNEGNMLINITTVEKSSTNFVDIHKKEHENSECCMHCRCNVNDKMHNEFSFRTRIMKRSYLSTKLTLIIWATFSANCNCIQISSIDNTEIPVCFFVAITSELIHEYLLIYLTL